MSEGADSITQTCENSLTTLKAEDNPEDLPPRVITYTGRRPRFGTGNTPLSPYILIDGKKLRSALALRKKWPPRRVNFPTNDNHLVTGYLEPANPWKLAENVSREDLISAYKESCVRHNTVPLESVLSQLENLDISENRSDQLNLKGETLDQSHSEPLEEILKRVQFNKVNLEGTSLDEESSVILFDMLEYYESARHLNISSNQEIGVRGWQACAHMIKKTQCLEQLEAKDVTLNEQYMNILSRALRLVCHLHVLKLENCGLSGRAIVILVAALKMNTGIRELYLADNGLDLYDAIQLGSLLRINNHLQLLDISNNNIQDDGVRDILEGLINQVNEDKDGKGLSILVLWNNRLTKKSSPYFNRIIALSKTLETLNIGQNTLTDELLHTVKDALKKNRILLQLGMQSTELTCEGIITLSEIIEVNQVLQRIDLRDNTIQMPGMKALSSSLKKNKNITQIDLDDKPRTKIDCSLHQYMEVVAEIRSCCLENEKNRATDGNTEGLESPKNHSRFCSASSRKISLTCQTLPCSSPSTTPIQSDESGRSMLEPKRASGGRLRSPAPSPIPSPVASPIPSPSRSRFVVSRVPEASLRSADSSASSSPVTPPSFGSSPTSFFPSASGSSRFRVSVVESASTVPSPKPIVASSKTNVTIGFSFKVDTVESTDSDDCDNVFRSELGMSNDQNKENVHNTSSNTSHVVENVTAKDAGTVSIEESIDVRELSTNQCFVEETSKVPSQDSVCSTSSDDKESYSVKDNQSNVPIQLESVTKTENAASIENYCNESTKGIQTHVNIKEDNADSSSTIITDRMINIVNERDATKEPVSKPSKEATQLPQQTKQNSTVQKHSSNLEKLLALFQHPGSFFSDSTNINQLESKSSFQDSMSSVMAFGDKFHHYLKEGREKVSSHGTWSSDESPSPAKSKSMKSSNISQLTGLQSLTNMFSSFKLDANLNLFEQNTKSCSKTAEHEDSTLEKKNGRDLVGAQEVGRTDVCNSSNTKSNVYNKEDGTNVSTSSNQSLPENVQSKSNDGHANKDLVLGEKCVVSNTTVDACSKIVNNSPLTNIPESKTTVCIPKLMDIPEYSVLEITEGNVKKENIEKMVDKVDSIPVEKTCDRTLTDSINVTSDSNDSSCNIICDIKVINNVHTIDTLESTYNSVRLHLNTKDVAEDSSAYSTHGKRNNLESFACKKDRDTNINNTSLMHHDASQVNLGTTDCLSNEVTSICSIDNNNDKEGLANSHNTSYKEINETDACHVGNDAHWKSTTVNSTSEVTLLSIDSNTDSSNEDAALCESSPTVSKEESTDAPQEDEPLEVFTNDDDKFSKPSNDIHRITLNETQSGNIFAKNTTDNTMKKAIDGTAVPTVILSHHETSGDTHIQTKCVVDFEKSDTDDLIFCITDISNDGASVEEELSPGTVSNNWSNDNTKITSPFYDLPQTSHSPTNLLIEKPENIHRNSQDSGIGETNLSTLDDNIPESMHSHPRESFQESVDSGIESECSSVYVKADSCMDISKEETPYAKKNSHNVTVDSASQTIHDLNDFSSNVVQHTEALVPDAATNTLNQPYFDKIKSAVVTSVRSMTRMDVTDTTPVGLISDENTTVVAEISTVTHAASPK